MPLLAGLLKIFQPGHKGKKRQLLPAEEMDAIHDIFPLNCEHCRQPLSQGLLDPARQPLRHQVIELPPIIPVKTEYRLHSLLCSCRRHTIAPLPEGVADSNFGPGVHAAIAYLMAVHRVSRRGIAEIMTTLFGIEISTGAVCKAAERVSTACGPVVGAIKRYVASAIMRASNPPIMRTTTPCSQQRRMVSDRTGTQCQYSHQK